MTTASTTRAVGSRSSRGARGDRRAFAVLVLVSIASSVGALDLSIMFVAYPEIRKTFDEAAPSLIGWVLTSYTIVIAAVMVTAGRLADRLGRKRVFLVGTAIFGLGSAASGLAPAVELLIAARVVQSIGGALVLPAALGLVLGEYPPVRHAWAIGVWATFGGVATASGPLLGAFVIDAWSWRWAFFVNVPIAAVMLIVGPRLLRETRGDEGVRLPDPFGTVLLILAIGVAALGITQGNTWGWTAGRTLAAFAASATLFGLFVVRSAHHPTPVLDLRLLTMPRSRAAYLCAIPTGICFYCTYFGLVQYARLAWGREIVDVGLLIMPVPIGSALASYVAGRLTDRVGHAVVIVFGGLCCVAAGIWFLTVLDRDQDVLTWIVGAGLFGIGAGALFPACNGAAVAGLPLEESSVGVGALQTVLRIGGALGAALGVSLVGDYVAGSSVKQFRDLWWLTAGTGFGCMLSGLVLRASVRAAGASPPARSAL
jgi:EmrB/QacA subfamily drug resistance transporter